MRFGVVEQTGLIRLLEEPRHLRQRMCVAFADLVLGNGVAVLQHPQAHALDIPVGRIEHHVDQSNLKAELPGPLDEAAVFRRGEDGLDADGLMGLDRCTDHCD
jgi:hypothetical protein